MSSAQQSQARKAELTKTSTYFETHSTLKNYDKRRGSIKRAHRTQNEINGNESLEWVKTFDTVALCSFRK